MQNPETHAAVQLGSRAKWAHATVPLRLGKVKRGPAGYLLPAEVNPKSLPRDAQRNPAHLRSWSGSSPAPLRANGCLPAAVLPCYEGCFSDFVRKRARRNPRKAERQQLSFPLNPAAVAGTQAEVWRVQDRKEAGIGGVYCLPKEPRWTGVSGASGTERGMTVGREDPQKRKLCLGRLWERGSSRSPVVWPCSSLARLMNPGQRG